MLAGNQQLILLEGAASNNYRLSAGRDTNTRLYPCPLPPTRRISSCSHLQNTDFVASSCSEPEAAQSPTMRMFPNKSLSPTDETIVSQDKTGHDNNADKFAQ